MGERECPTDATLRHRVHDDDHRPPPLPAAALEIHLECIEPSFGVDRGEVQNKVCWWSFGRWMRWINEGWLRGRKIHCRCSCVLSRSGSEAGAKSGGGARKKGSRMEAARPNQNGMKVRSGDGGGYCWHKSEIVKAELLQWAHQVRVDDGFGTSLNGRLGETARLLHPTTTTTTTTQQGMGKGMGKLNKIERTRKREKRTRVYIIFRIHRTQTPKSNAERTPNSPCRTLKRSGKCASGLEKTELHPQLTHTLLHGGHTPGHGQGNW